MGRFCGGVWDEMCLEVSGKWLNVFSELFGRFLKSKVFMRKKKSVHMYIYAYTYMYV